MVVLPLMVIGVTMMALAVLFAVIPAFGFAVLVAVWLGVFGLGFFLFGLFSLNMGGVILGVAAITVLVVALILLVYLSLFVWS